VSISWPPRVALLRGISAAAPRISAAPISRRRAAHSSVAQAQRGHAPHDAHATRADPTLQHEQRSGAKSNAPTPGASWPRAALPTRRVNAPRRRTQLSRTGQRGHAPHDAHATRPDPTLQHEQRSDAKSNPPTP